jgi:biotin carboxylase
MVQAEDGRANEVLVDEQAQHGAHAFTSSRPRVLLLTTATTYRTTAFLEAAERLGIEAIPAINMPEQLATYWNEQLGLEFGDPQKASEAIVHYATEHPIAAIIAVDDSGSLLAAHASNALRLPHNAPEAALAARDKYEMRVLLGRGVVPSPPFALHTTAEDAHAIAAQTHYPCVVKPLRLSGSRGVMRADNRQELVTAIERLGRMLRALEPGSEPSPFLVEAFIPGFEVALEGLLDNGTLQVVALFDKPDPLDGPFFEETLYVTPSRLPPDVQAAIGRCAADAARALGLREGPMHAELRVNEHGPWIVELAGRSIGGLCSKTLRFGTDASLEELILRQAVGQDTASLQRTGSAGGVMMIPIPSAGMLRRIDGLEAACAVPGVEEIDITAKLNYPLVPLPEGDSYLGFIFARGATADEVEATLRQAHAQLRFTIVPAIDLVAR